MKETEKIREMKVLHVGNDRHARNLIGSMLYSQPLTIHQVRTGKQAMRALDRMSYDLIVCDNRLPDMSGSEFCNKISDMQSEAGRLLIVVNEREASSGTKEAYLIVINEYENKVHKEVEPVALTVAG